MDRTDDLRSLEFGEQRIVRRGDADEPRFPDAQVFALGQDVARVAGVQDANAELARNWRNRQGNGGLACYRAATSKETEITCYKSMRYS